MFRRHCAGHPRRPEAGQRELRITFSTSPRNYYCLRDHELASGSSKRAFVTPNPDLASRYDPTDSKAPGSAR